MNLSLSLSEATQLCEHCHTSFTGAPTARFCCGGCEFVFNFISDNGFSQFYQIRDLNPPTCPIPAVINSSKFDYCDDPEFIKSTALDQNRMRFYLEGLNCTACIWLLEKLPSFCSDALWTRVNLSNSTIEVCKKPEGSFACIAQAINNLGYHPHALRDKDSIAEYQKRENRLELVRLGVAAAATGNIMIFSVSLYGGSDGALGENFKWLSALLALPVLTYCAWPFYKAAYSGLKTRNLNIDIPIVFALLAGIASSFWGLFTSRETLYFDSLSMLVFLLLGSRFALKSLQSRHFDATHLEDELLLSTVSKVDPSTNKMTPVSSLSLVKGDLISITPDSTIPVDGTVYSGEAILSTAVLTGETDSFTQSAGSFVEAGSFSQNGNWVLQVTNPPRETRLSQILRDTETAAKNKSHLVRLSDKVAHYFIALTLTMALAVFIYFLGSDPQEGLTRALALVIVTCPCVFGLAIPLSMNLALRSAAKKGIILKDSNAIEALWKIKNIFFDKTGTLSTGKMKVLSMSTAQDETLLPVVLGLQKQSPHPVAKAFRDHLSRLNVKESTVTDVHNLDRGGISGYFEEISYSVKPIVASSSGKSLNSKFGFFKNEQLVGSADLSDQPRPEAMSVLSELRSLGFETHLLSGDKAQVVKQCGEILDFKASNIFFEKTPLEKANILTAQPDSLMIGDGANDAAALATAKVGIAMFGSLDVSLRAADVYLTRPNLSLILDLLAIAKKTKSAIFRNLLFSSSFNILSGTLAMSGLMSPLLAAVLMPLSSLVVLLSSLSTGKKL